MSIDEQAEKIEAEARDYLNSLGEDFLKTNKGKTIVVFPKIKEHRIFDNAIDANKLTSSDAKYQNEISFVFNL